MPPKPLTSALDQLRALWASGQRAAALSMAAKWPNHGTAEAKATIQRGQAARLSPDLYRQMGRDPVELYRAALVALANRHKLDTKGIDHEVL